MIHVIKIVSYRLPGQRTTLVFRFAYHEPIYNRIEPTTDIVHEKNIGCTQIVIGKLIKHNYI